MRARPLAFLALATALTALAGACGGTGQAPSGGTGASSGTGTSSGGSGGSGGVGGGIDLNCNPPCSGGQICSVAKTCIDAGTCIEDGDCLAGTICDKPTSTCIPGGMCGTEETQISAIPPNLLFVVDRSCSMTQKVNGVAKWTIAVQAINKVTTDYNGKIRFGLSLFPDLVAPSCAQDAIILPVAPGNETAIQTLLTASLAANDPYYPDGPCVTNIDTAMQQATTEPAFNDVDRSSYAVLVTDGQQSSCNVAGGDNGTTQIITDLFQTRKVATFVLGFGSGVDPAQMNIFADAGGVPSGDPMTHYYKAEDQASLDAALAAIATKTLSCTFKLATTPPHPDDLYVFFGKTPVARDATHTTGWDYDAATNTVTFYGTTCDDLKSGAVTDVHVVFGCGGSTG